VADVNGDGKPDIVVTDLFGDISVLLGKGNGLFGTAAAFSAGFAPVVVTTADVNGDGRPDLIASDFDDHDVVVLLNTSQAPRALDSASIAPAPGHDTGLVIDTTAPAVTETLVSSTGSNASGGITDTPALTGTGDANAVVTISNGTAVLGTTTADASDAGISALIWSMAVIP
jgi:FG-GAP-like repeat